MSKHIGLTAVLSSVITAIILILIWALFLKNGVGKIFSPVSELIHPRPLLAFTFSALRKRTYSSKIQILDLMDSQQAFNTFRFIYESDGRKISGVANFPPAVSASSSAGWDRPVIVMIHGFASSTEYFPGFGTEHVGEEFAKAGYITFAPDFEGYGSSDKPPSDPFEERFDTYTAVLNLLAGLKSECPGCREMIWGHSNGGQIALSVLEISGQPYPAILWNPVSKHFPYNILYYTDSFDDQGRWLRKALAKFEDDYNVDDYDTAFFFDWISPTSDILLQQGENDEWVPKIWSDELAQTLLKKDKKLTYKIYPGADHNLEPGWNKAVSDDLSFLSRETGR